MQSSGVRQFPDVSFDADPGKTTSGGTSVDIYDSYDYGSSSPWDAGGGTSLGTPCWAGLIADADQLREQKSASHAC